MLRSLCAKFLLHRTNKILPEKLSTALHASFDLRIAKEKPGTPAFSVVKTEALVLVNKFSTHERGGSGKNGPTPLTTQKNNIEKSNNYNSAQRAKKIRIFL